MTSTPKGHIPDRNFHADSEYMLDIVPELNLAKLLKKNSQLVYNGSMYKSQPSPAKIYPPTNQVCFPRF